MKQVRLLCNTVAEIIPESATIPSVAYWYGEAFASQCLEAPDEVEVRWLYNPDTGEFSPPPAEADGEPDEITRLRLAVAELAERQAALDLENKLAIAELAEALLGGEA